MLEEQVRVTCQQGREWQGGSETTRGWGNANKAGNGKESETTRGRGNANKARNGKKSETTRGWGAGLRQGPFPNLLIPLTI